MSRREELFASGVQFGHQTRAWCPKMSRYIWGEKDGVHLINIALTEMQIEKAEKMLEAISQKGLSILWVGTKRVARDIISRCAQETEQPYFSDRWIGGTLTNYHEVKKAVTNMLYNKEILEKADRQLYTKKELNVLQKKIERAEKSVGGIERLGQRPGVIVMIGVKEERVALREAERMGIPVIALVDTNCDPSGVTLVVPANDDRESSISLILGYFTEAVKRGREEFLKNNPTGTVEDSESRKQNQGPRKQQHGGRPQQHTRPARKEETASPSVTAAPSEARVEKKNNPAPEKKFNRPKNPSQGQPQAARQPEKQLTIKEEVAEKSKLLSLSSASSVVATDTGEKKRTIPVKKAANAGTVQKTTKKSSDHDTVKKTESKKSDDSKAETKTEA